MSWYEDYKTRINIQGGSIRDAHLESMKQNILNGFYNNPSYTQVYINTSPTPSDVWIVDDSKIKELKTITTKPGDIISNGDLVRWNDEYWLTLIVDDMQMYYRGSIQRCPSSLVFQNSSLSTIEAPFTLESTPSQLGLDEGRIISLPNERRNIIIQSNPDTQQIVKGQRFIFDGRAWKCTGLNGLVDGLLYLTLEEDQINTANDNLALRIADYKQPSTTEPDPIPSTGYSIVIVGSDTIKQNQIQTYMAEIYQDNVKITDGSQLVTFTLHTDDKRSTSTLGAISAQDGIKCSVKNNNVTSGSVWLKCSLVDDENAVAWKQIQMRPLW